MKNKKLMLVLGVIFVSALLMTGCAATRPVRDAMTKVNLVEKDYEILGRVEYKGTLRNVLGFVTWGRAAYYKLYDKAREDFGADDVMNISVDYKDTSIGIFYNSRTYIMSGLAIKYK